MATNTNTYLDIYAEVPLFAFTAAAALVPAFTVPTLRESVLAMSSDTAFYVKKGDATVVATTNSMRIPPNTLYHLKINPGERVSIIGAGAGNASMTLLQ